MARKREAAAAPAPHDARCQATGASPLIPNKRLFDSSHQCKPAFAQRGQGVQGPGLCERLRANKGPGRIVTLDSPLPNQPTRDNCEALSNRRCPRASKPPGHFVQALIGRAASPGWPSVDGFPLRFCAAAQTEQLSAKDLDVACSAYEHVTYQLYSGEMWLDKRSPSHNRAGCMHHLAPGGYLSIERIQQRAQVLWMNQYLQP